MKNVFLVTILSLGLGLSITSYAQTQKGYSNDGQPDISVDRSVLEDLKGYEPPPMFSDPAPQPDVVITHPDGDPVTGAKIQPPAEPTLTSPKAEDFLSHPTQNFHVLTERHSAIAPEVKGKKATPTKSIPAAKQEDKKQSKTTDEKPKVIPETKPTPKSDVKEKATKPEKKKSADKPVPKAEPKAEPKKSTEAPKKAEKKEAYKPKSQELMPAVPSAKIEKNVLPPMSENGLPALPNPDASSEESQKPSISKPSVGLRMMDAALERQMESDEDKIKDKLIHSDTPVVDNSKKPTTPSKTLIFKSNETDLNATLLKQIDKNILPNLMKNTQTRIQILSFSKSPDNDDDKARMISLARALAVRDYLKSKQIDVGRIDVRALASKNSPLPPDRIDIVPLK